MSPADLVRLAAKAGVDAISLTDHDEVSGLDEAVEAGRECGVALDVPFDDVPVIDAGGARVAAIGQYEPSLELQRVDLERHTRDARRTELDR